MRAAITTKYVIRAYRDFDKIHIKPMFQSEKALEPKDYDAIMAVINRDGRFDEYLNGFLSDLIQWDMDKNYQQKDYALDIGAVFFLETLLRDDDNDPYVAEPMQFYLLLDPMTDSVATITRRGAKSFSNRVLAYRNCIAHNRYGVMVTAQSWELAKQWLDDVYLWHESNQLLSDWSGGRLRQDAGHHIEFGNRSFMMCYTASNLMNVRGIGVKMVIFDEKAAYVANTAVARLIARGQKKKLGRGSAIFRTSSTPIGSGTDFHEKDQLSNRKTQYYAPMLCPCGYKKPICFDCEHYTLTQYRRGKIPNLVKLECTAPIDYLDDGSPDFSKSWKRVDRIDYDELKEDFFALGKTMFLQEYMCASVDYTGNAIPLELIQAITKDDLEPVFKSELPCYVGVDFGLREKHNSAISVVGMHENGKLQNLYSRFLPVNTPYTTIPGGQVGVLNHVIALFQNYPNIRRIVADATGVGLPLVEPGHQEINLSDMCRKFNGFADVVPYKFAGESKQFMGKSQMYLSLIKPAMESGKISTYMDRRLYSEMRAWQMDYEPSQQKHATLHPPKHGAVQTDDVLISFFLALYGALAQPEGMGQEGLIMGSISSQEAYGLSAFEKAAYR